MEYPRIPRDKKRNIKIKSHQIQEIRVLYANGHSQRQIASMFGVSKFCIFYHLKTQEQRDEDRKNRKPYKQSKEKCRQQARETYLHRIKVIGKDVLRHQNLKKVKGYTSERRLESWQFHKEKLEQLLESEPLLILFRGKKDKIILNILNPSNR